ncbi:hypothetical protein C3486_11850 [Streptomyces sp. Ru73]|uniref:trypsin-like serine peptidase n=1 Tax=Streptomyces sp. Ru73 TaxID=2080748 RepID=UPI000CDDF2F9|nr:hypothetical protein [Streptomyces sp. Ru73]POX40878.1 hypothetical protein C3486_11850 [Streptomyces sp. Ru73]
MPSIRRTAAAAVAVAALLVTATACGPEDTKAAGADSAAESTGPSDAAKLPNGLPKSLDSLKKWENGGWKNWDKDTWARKAKDFANPVIKDLWKPSRMAKAEAAPAVTAQSAGSGGGPGTTDPEPRPVTAQQVERPYHQHMAPIGKIFFDSPDGPMVCSGTVVSDPANPGKSNLVWTAGHCVHSGRSGGWMRNIVFVPSYNDNGLPANQVSASSQQNVTPYGTWWADWSQTSSQWIDGGAHSGNAASAYDFAVLHVKPENGGGKSLEETVGASVPVWFGAPQGSGVTGLDGVKAIGYPQAPPYDGAKMMNCLDRPVRLTMAQSTPAMHWIGCSMTGGTSGGGWLADHDGKLSLVSNSSIGSLDHTWLAGPHLGAEAKGVFDAISKKFAGQ